VNPSGEKKKRREEKKGRRRKDRDFVLLAPDRRRDG